MKNNIESTLTELQSMADMRGFGEPKDGQDQWELRVTQNNIGRYNLCSTEKTLSFYMGIFRNGQIVEHDGVKAQIHYSGIPEDQEYFRSPFTDLENVFEKCFEYVCGIWSSHDYRSDAILFAKTYQENYEQINAYMAEKERKRIEEKIKALERDLERTEVVPDLEHSISFCANKEIKKYTSWLDKEEQKLGELKENAESRSNIQKRIDSCTNKIKIYQSLLSLGDIAKERDKVY